MRKLLRMKMRYQAEAEMKSARKQMSKAKVKKPIGYRTIDVFRYLWKRYKKSIGQAYAGEVPVKRRGSLLHRAKESVKALNPLGMSR